MGKTYVNDDKSLSFKLISDEKKYYNITSPLLDFDSTSKDLKFKCTSETLSLGTEKPLLGVIDDRVLSYLIVSKNLIFVNISTLLPSYRTASKNLEYINNSKVLSFNLHDYDSSIPIFQILLEFFNETGGVF